MDATEIFTALGTPAGRADPYPHYAALHELGEAVSLAPGAVVVVGYDAISAVLRDPGFAVSDEAQLRRGASPAGGQTRCSCRRWTGYSTSTGPSTPGSAA